jgi:hypothetical protein
MISEAIRLLWHTITSSWRRKSTPDEPRPGDDNQWSTWPRIRIADYLNPEDQADQDERTWKP